MYSCVFSHTRPNCFSQTVISNLYGLNQQYTHYRITTMQPLKRRQIVMWSRGSKREPAEVGVAGKQSNIKQDDSLKRLCLTACLPCSKLNHSQTFSTQRLHFHPSPPTPQTGFLRTFSQNHFLITFNRLLYYCKPSHLSITAA